MIIIIGTENFTVVLVPNLLYGKYMNKIPIGGIVFVFG
jgi:hypothetical protein